MAVQRNAIVAPFSVNSPFLEKSAPIRKGQEATHVVAVTHQKYFTQIETGVNNSLQIAPKVPTSSTSPGEPGFVAFDSNWFYICVGANTWRRAALNSF